MTLAHGVQDLPDCDHDVVKAAVEVVGDERFASVRSRLAVGER